MTTPTDNDPKDWAVQVTVLGNQMQHVYRLKLQRFEVDAVVRDALSKGRPIEIYDDNNCLATTVQLRGTAVQVAIQPWADFQKQVEEQQRQMEAHQARQRLGASGMVPPLLHTKPKGRG